MVVMKTIAVTIATFFLVLRIAFGQSSQTEKVTLTMASSLDIGYGGVDDYVFNVDADTAGNLFTAGGWAPDYKSWKEAGLSKISPTGKVLWQVSWGADTLSTSVMHQMVYKPEENAVFAATLEEVTNAPALIGKFDAEDGHQIWQITEESRSLYFLHGWRQYLLVLRSGSNPTLSLLQDSTGAVENVFSVADYIGGIISLQTLGDSLWVFSSQFMAKFLLPSGQLLWKIPTTDFTIGEAQRTLGTIDKNGNSFIVASDRWDFVKGLMPFTAAEYSSDGHKLWTSSWYGWADTSSAVGLNLNNWVNGIAVNESLKLVVVYGGVQKAGTNGFDNNLQSSYLAILNSTNGDTLKTGKSDDAQNPQSITSNWNGGFFNQQNQLVLFGFSGSGLLHVPVHNFIKVFNLDIVDAVRPEPPSVPSTFTLDQNYPNPFNPTTIIRYSVPKRSFVTLSVYNVLGQLVKTLVQDEKSPGTYEVSFDGSSLPSGVYLSILRAGNSTEMRKMVLIK